MKRSPANGDEGLEPRPLCTGNMCVLSQVCHHLRTFHFLLNLKTFKYLFYYSLMRKTEGEKREGRERERTQQGITHGTRNETQDLILESPAL